MMMSQISTLSHRILQYFAFRLTSFCVCPFAFVQASRKTKHHYLSCGNRWRDWFVLLDLWPPSDNIIKSNAAPFPNKQAKTSKSSTRTAMAISAYINSQNNQPSSLTIQLYFNNVQSAFNQICFRNKWVLTVTVHWNCIIWQLEFRNVQGLETICSFISDLRSFTWLSHSFSRSIGNLKFN